MMLCLGFGYLGQLLLLRHSVKVCLQLLEDICEGTGLLALRFTPFGLHFCHDEPRPVPSKMASDGLQACM